MKDIKEIRDSIDIIDDEIASLFCKRMALSDEVAEYKKANSLPIINAGREREIVSRVTSNREYRDAIALKTLFNTLFDLSKASQEMRLSGGSSTEALIKNAVANTAREFPKRARVACQGIEGANSALACDKLFSLSDITFFSSFDGVFKAVEAGLCEYGILPIENSLHGSVRSVYDAMRKHRFYIVKSLKLKINHCLMAKPGVKLSDIKEITSHEQALAQCSDYISSLSGTKTVPCENTAIAAKLVADSDRCDIAAIGAPSAAKIYGLDILASDIENSDNNYTRFICISKSPEIYPGANKISLMLTLPHEPGTLYRLISRFAATGMNLTKLESRPIANRDFEFMFYLEMDASAVSDDTIALLSSLEKMPGEFTFLGNFQEI